MPIEKQRSPLFCAMLNLFCPGLGFLYLDRVALGIVAVALSPIIFFVAGRSGLVFSQNGFLAISIVAVGCWLGMAAWAFLIAKKQRAIQPGRLQRWYVYVGFVLAVGVSMTLVMAARGVLFGYDMFRIPSPSMENTLLIGDNFISDTQAFRSRMPRRGEVIVFEKPPQPSLKYVQRVIGLPGEKIELRNGNVFVDGIRIADEHVAAENNKGLHPAASEFTVPSDAYFLLGDNRDNSFDSRYFGFVPAKNIYGSVEFIWFSSGEDGVRWDRIGRRIE